MAETSLVAVRAAVFYYDAAQNNWRPADDGISRVDLYANNAAQTFRVVAISAKSNDVVVNSPLYKDLKYQRASSMFHQWSDARFAYGLNFASLEEAESFASAVESAANKSRTREGSASRLMQPRLRIDDELEYEGSPDCERRKMSVSSAAPGTPDLARTGEAPEDLQRKMADRRERAETEPVPPNLQATSPLSPGGAQAPPRRPQMSLGSTPRPPNTGSLRLGSASKSDLDALKLELTLAFKKEIEAMKRDVLEAVARMNGAVVVQQPQPQGQVYIPPPRPPPPL
eukprot:m51a1_g9056 putative ena vasp-like protein isoform x2 (285) ;mRNA; f:59630-61200